MSHFHSLALSLYIEKSTGQAILKSESRLVNMALGERELDALNS